jgi:TonB family protein
MEPAEPVQAAPQSGGHEEIPQVPPRALQTIHGHIAISVRVIVDKDGTVFAALLDHPGRSKYFEQLAIEAAKKWTFPPADTDERLVMIAFDFTHDGTTAHAEGIH